MPERRIYDENGHAHFVTFSCYKRRRLLDRDEAKQIVLDVLGTQLARRQGRCLGFVVMPDHVHALVWFPEPGQVSEFMRQWKAQSSRAIKRLFRTILRQYAGHIDSREPVWQARYYGFNVISKHKALEKLRYMHTNPVRAGLVESTAQWEHSSARFYEEGVPADIPVGLPE
ncbi:MAG TPA: transposase [Planctomycetota bacterium]|nr:transposase [Planctomycetota bacterium]